MRRHIKELVIFFVSSCMVRTIYVLVTAGKYGTAQISDSLYMHRLAESLVAGEGFTLDGVWIFNQSVGYPAFMSFFYMCFGPNIWVALVVNILLGGVGVVLIYLLSQRLFTQTFGVNNPRLVARCAASMAAIYPDSLLYCGMFSSENLLIPLVLVLLLLSLASWQRPVAEGALTGLAAALAASVKAYVIFLGFFLPILWHVQGRRFVRITVAAAVVGALCLLPWTLLNYQASGGYLVPFTAVSGEVLLDCTNPSARGTPTGLISLPPEIEAGVHPVEVDKLKMKKALGYIREDPIWFIKLTFKKFLLAFSPARDFMFENYEQYRFFTPFLSKWLPTAFNLMVILGTLAGLVILRKERKRFVFALGPFVTMVLIQLIFCAYSRYRFPFLFSLLPVCAYGFLFFLDVIQKRFGRGSSPTTSAPE